MARPSSGKVQSRARCMGVTIAGSLYALPLEQVQEVIAARPLSRLFHAPPLLSGVTSLRGEVLPVLEPALLFGGQASAPLEGCIVVVRERGGAARRAGLRVSSLSGLRELPEEGLLPVPSTLPPEVAGLILGVLGEQPPCAVLDVTALLDNPGLAGFAPAPGAA